MYWNLFVRPKFRTTQQADVCVTMFECDDEELVRALFYKRHVGMEIIITAKHPTLKRAHLQIRAMGTIIKSHFEFWEKTMMCDLCGIHTVSKMSSEHICDYCNEAKEDKKNTGKP